MYATQVSQAIRDVCTELDSAVTGGRTDHPRAVPFLRDALDRIVNDLYAVLSMAGRRGQMGLLMGSNFLRRAAFDLYGPCLVAGMLYQRGEWSVASALWTARTRGVVATTTSIGRSFITNFVYGLAPTVADRVDRLIRQIVDAHVEFGREVILRLHADAGLLNHLFGVTGGPTALYFAGSDPHRCAHRVAIVTYANGRVVYKPTDLSFQLMLMGSAASFAIRHRGSPHPITGRHRPLQIPMGMRSLFETLALDMPTLHIAARGGYGYMEFKRKAGPVSALAAPRFYRKMGKLLAVASVLGITDLHEENIMATDDGPYIIDAEMGFAFPNLGAQPNAVVSKTSIHRAIRIHPQQHSIAGGGFAPYLDAGGWEAHSISLPYDANDINSGITDGASRYDPRGGRLLGAIVLGIDEAVDGMATRLDRIWNWLLRFRQVSPSPLARVLLNTTDMVAAFNSGVAARINGTLRTAQQARSGTFMEWMEWYGGEHFAVPAALYSPDTRAVYYDPRGWVGASAQAGATHGVSANNSHELRFRLGMMLMGSGVANTKVLLRRGLAQVLGVAESRTAA